MVSASNSRKFPRARASSAPMWGDNTSRHQDESLGGVSDESGRRRPLRSYLAVRRKLGYDLGTTERVLRRFVDFAQAEQARHITTALLLRWKDAFGQAGRQTWAARFGTVRLFAQWLNGLDPAHEVPPRGLIPSGS